MATFITVPPEKEITEAIAAVMTGGYKSAVVFCGSRKRQPKLRVKATRKAKDKSQILLSIGKPNYAERRFAKNRIRIFGSFPKLWTRK